MCRISQADVGDTLYQYDASGWLTAYQNGASRGTNCATLSGSGKVTLVRDDVGRITKRDYADSFTPDISKTYDANGNVKTVNRNGINWRYSYNSINLPTSELLSVDGREYAISYGYSNAGYMSTMTYPTGKTINYNPDGLGRPRQANWGSTYYANHIDYHANGQISSLLYGNGFTYKQLLNARQLPERLISTKGTTKALDLTYSYDKRHLITSITDAATSGNNRNMSYDALERLTSSTGPWGNGQISYDSLGNILTKNLGNRYVSMSYDESNRLIRANDSGGLGGSTGDRHFSYDSRGNITSSGNLHFAYDYSDQPVSMHGDESGSYRYDGNLKRVKATVAGKTLYNVYNLAGQLIHIDDASRGKRTDYVNAGSMTIARVINNVPTYVHHDIVGSPVTGTNSNGAIAWRERYTPFGITLDNESANDDQAGYTGHIKDSNTGLVYMQARYYDPVIGRFYSNDPVDAATFLGQGNVQGFNRYAYANNNPYAFIDPDGNNAVRVLAAVAKDPVRTGRQIGRGARLAAEGLGIISAAENAGNGSDQGIVNGDVPAGLADGPIVEGDNSAPEGGTIFVDSDGNALVGPEGSTIAGSPDGTYTQVKDKDGNPTGTRKDGGHNPAGHPDSRAQNPHGHVEGVSNADGTPWLPLKEKQ